MRLDRLDAESSQRLDKGLRAANAYWTGTGRSERARRDGPDLALRHAGRERRVTVHEEGLLLRASRVLHDTTAVAYLGRVRFAARGAVARDAGLARDAANALFVLRDGRRRDAPSITALLVHELVHVRQALDLPLGGLGFTVAYALTLGRPFEREAYAAGRAAHRWSAAARGST